MCEWEKRERKTKAGIPKNPNECSASDELADALKFRKKTAVDYALDHFDNYYAKLYGKQWPSVRLGLLSPNKYCAVINRHCRTHKQTITRLQSSGAFELLDAARRERLASNVQLNIERRKSKKEGEEVSEYDMESEASADMVDDGSQTHVHTLMRSEHAATLRDDRANLNEFVPVTEIVSDNELLLRSKQHTLVDTSEFSDLAAADVQLVADESDLQLPSNLNVFTFPKGDFTRFDPAQADSANRLEYYVLDSASLLPVLALNVPEGASVLDMCAGPGGKAFCVHQTGAARRLVCIDIRRARIQRVANTFRLYTNVVARDNTEIPECMQMDARELPFADTFDRVLCDVPCSADRHALETPETNLFMPSRYRERLRLTDIQSDLLLSALKCTRPGGFVVYSTCTLSAVQNDGVVLSTLARVQTETRMRVALVDLTPLRRTFVDVFRFAPAQYGTGVAPVARCGLLVVPYLPLNHGPMFVCKLQRLE